jgi:Protein of unknown function (DUF4242)
MLSSSFAIRLPGTAGSQVASRERRKEGSSGTATSSSRSDGWRSADKLELAAQRSTVEGDRHGDVRWIRSYLLEEGEGLGTVCTYEAESEEPIRGHVEDAGLSVTDVIKVADTVIVRPDLAPAAAG